MKKMLLACLVACSFNTTAAVVVIGNPQGADSISVEDVKKLYLGKSTKLNGANVTLFEMPEGSVERIEFHGKTTDRTDAQLQSNWSRLVFTGKAEAPVNQVDAAAMINGVKSTANSIGYIDESQLTSDVKVLLKL
ncbi:phosphate ABC transporter substrate-binding protein [Shewanella halifaxensis]|uniref:phosphate ABC transporter substrate-binding protein n=1 Tax=Shewanella halifaxensis TaxID=271098 RepID=UPI000D594D41|nr:phosphate ABC transporter substrate-binding protein [Shewanella halifaxensis]